MIGEVESKQLALNFARLSWLLNRDWLSLAVYLSMTGL